MLPRRFKTAGLVLLITAFTGALPGCAPPGEPKAEVITTRLVPFTTARGQSTHMVLADWKNTGTAPVGVVHADISAYDAAGNRLHSSVYDYTIFAASSDAKTIKPGQSYIEPYGEGFVLIPVPGEAMPAKARVTITRVAEKSALQ